MFIASQGNRATLTLTRRRACCLYRLPAFVDPPHMVSTVTARRSFTLLITLMMSGCTGEPGDTTGDSTSTETSAAASTGAPTTGETDTDTSDPEALRACDEAIAAAPADAILIYTWQNQIQGSTLQFLADGTIVHDERTCCPPTITPFTEPVLTAAVLTQLATATAEAAAGPVTSEELGVMAEGQLTGSLCARGSDGPVVILVHVPAPAADAPVIAHSNASEAATTLLDFVAGYAEVDPT